MSWFTNMVSGGAGSLITSIKEAADEFNLSGEEKQDFILKKKDFDLKLEALIQARDSEIEQTLRTNLEAKERVLVAELTQGDSYTKRARPTVVYFGLFVIFFNYCFIPVLGALIGMFGPAAAITATTATVFPTLTLPTAFWTAWGGICSTWSIGRSLERVGVKNAATRAVTGSKLLS